MKGTGGWRAAVVGATGVLAVGTTFAAVTASPAQAHGAPGDKYQGEKKDVVVESERVNEAGRTTFTFDLKTNGEDVSHVVLMTCPDVDVVSATGAAGATKEGDTPKTDPSIDGEHVGIRFEPGAPGAYTIVFSGNIAAAQFVVKDGDGHAHFTEGQESDVCNTVTEQTTETPTKNPPANEPPAGNPAGNPPASNPPVNNPPASPAHQPDAEVQGATATNEPPTEVLGTQVAQPEALAATLPRTGPALPLLVPIGAMLVAFGGLATAIARRR